MKADQQRDDQPDEQVAAVLLALDRIYAAVLDSGDDSCTLDLAADERTLARWVDAFEGLLPHLSQAVQLSQLLAATRSEGALHGRLAAVFLDDQGDVIAVGPRAEALLRRCTRLRVEDRRLRSTDGRVDRWLAKLGTNTVDDALPERAVEVTSRVESIGGPCWLDDPAARLRLDATTCPAPLPTWTSPGAPPATIVLLEADPPGAGLPASLCEIAELLAEGLSDKEIADRCGRPLSTVRTYVARLYQRTGLRSRAALTKWWWSLRTDRPATHP